VIQDFAQSYPQGTELALAGIGLMLAFAASPAITGGPLSAGDFRYTARQVVFAAMAVPQRLSAQDTELPGLSIELIDPKAFGGDEAFRRETGFLAKACRSSRPRAGVAAVKMPGDTALARRRAQLEKGVELYESIMPALTPWADKFKITPPAPDGVRRWRV